MKKYDKAFLNSSFTKLEKVDKCVQGEGLVSQMWTSTWKFTQIIWQYVCMKNFHSALFNRECMERNVMTSFQILSSFEYFLRYFQTELSAFFTLQCELFTSCNVSNNANLVSAQTGGEGVVIQCGQA